MNIRVIASGLTRIIPDQRLETSITAVRIGEIVLELGRLLSLDHLTTRDARSCGASKTQQHDARKAPEQEQQTGLERPSHARERVPWTMTPLAPSRAGFGG